MESTNFMDDRFTNPYATFASDVPQKNKQQPWMQSSNMGLPQEIVGMSVQVTPVDWKTREPMNTSQVTTYAGRSEERYFCHNSESFYSDESFLGFIDERVSRERNKMFGVLSCIEWDEYAEAFYCGSYITPWQRFEIKPLPQKLMDVCRRSFLRLRNVLDLR